MSFDYFKIDRLTEITEDYLRKNKWEFVEGFDYESNTRSYYHKDYRYRLIWRPDYNRWNIVDMGPDIFELRRLYWEKDRNSENRFIPYVFSTPVSIPAELLLKDIL